MCRNSLTALSPPSPESKTPMALDEDILKPSFRNCIKSYFLIITYKACGFKLKTKNNAPGKKIKARLQGINLYPATEPALMSFEFTDFATDFN